jgi:hypothetical protein
LLIALPLAAQTGGEKPARVEGVVTNSVTGDPVPRAHVALDGLTGNQHSQHGTMSSADGKFSLDGLAPGSWWAAAERIGFVTSNAEDRTRFTLGAGDNKTGIEIKLTPTGAITGRVTDADGEPVEFASVEAQGGNGAIASRPTDERGQFRLGGLAPGRYRVKVSLYDSRVGRLKFAPMELLKFTMRRRIIRARLPKRRQGRFWCGRRAKLRVSIFSWCGLRL